MRRTEYIYIYIKSICTEMIKYRILAPPPKAKSKCGPVQTVIWCSANVLFFSNEYFWPSEPAGDYEAQGENVSRGVNVLDSFAFCRYRLSTYTILQCVRCNERYRWLGWKTRFPKFHHLRWSGTRTRTYALYTKRMHAVVVLLLLLLLRRRLGGRNIFDTKKKKKQNETKIRQQSPLSAGREWDT